MSNYNEHFLKQSPLAVLGVLRDLHKNQVPIRISWQSGQFITKILEVTAAGLIVDFGSQSQENQAAQKAANIQFTAETEGAKVEFTLPKIQPVNYLNLPAFHAPIPPTLWFVQRREYFRITAPLQPYYLCNTTLPNGSPFQFRLCDLSLGGMGALVDGPLPEGLKDGMRFSQVELDLVQWGKFHFDMQLITLSERKVIDSKNQTISTPRLSFRFLNVNPAVERQLQRIIFSLERSAREKAGRIK
ncbi:flagellar brake protein [Buttiauxella selenatireducens]|uniref:Flagellar brake protein YcgR n=1 Tax=Buttiauxella selenatireducens TaxID=3073902 RepID=A0ABY9SFJ2_9ENTR|nr:MULTISPECIES: flagellar brake protein [unclassified Buttiauxella]WMY76274.1 flagellar brake protein [Buttiauxella sp. R73]